MGGAVTRRDALGMIAAGAAAGLAACTKRMPTNTPEVVLYSSVDDEYLRIVVARFESEHNLRVLVKGDTEATKTTGLVERLRAEHAAGNAGADVWWSSEPFLTIALADEGVLAPMPDSAFGDLPVEHRGEGNLWGSFALRARVVVRRGGGESAGTDILSESFTGAAPAIARAAFGTTRGHFAAVLATVGEERYVAWLRALRAGGARVLDGNSAVVRAVAAGEASVGLTDTDDVWAGQREGWDVSCSAALIGSDAVGPLMIPNTVALVQHGANPSHGARLARFLMSDAVERVLMESASHNMPVRAGLMQEMRAGALGRYVVENRGGSTAVPVAVAPTLRAIAAAATRAVELAKAEGLA